MRCGLTTLSIMLLSAAARAGLPTPTPTPVANGKIAFSSDRNGNQEIYVMDADGSIQTPLTNDPAFDYDPAWSPDGTKIAFSSNRDGNFEIYVMDANGSNQTRLTNNPANDLRATWSPDGAKIAFGSIRDGNFEIYLMNADGSNQINLTNYPGSDFHPAWSPDGAEILFNSERAGDASEEIYVMDANGSNPMRVTNNEFYDDYPAWSPDGAKIAFTSHRGGSEIYVMNADGSNQTPLTNNTAVDSFAAWSPDGAKIVFYSGRDIQGPPIATNYEIYIMEADGSNQTNLTNTPGEDSYPNWQGISAFATPTPTGTPGPTPTPSPAQTLNISTRMRVETGDSVMIGGFIITGNAPKKVALRGIGPSLNNVGLSDVLADPTLELRESGGALLMQNNNWQDDPAQAAELTALGLALQDPNESGIVSTLPPGSYTAILAGNNQTAGIGLVEIYDADSTVASQLANISTRGFVRTGDNVMIGGFILGQGDANVAVAVRGIGPSLSQSGLNNVLVDPTLDLRDSNGALLSTNDDWQDDAAAAAQLTAHGLAPQDPAESGIFAILPPGAFTAILAGEQGGIGLGLVEIYSDL